MERKRDSFTQPFSRLNILLSLLIVALMLGFTFFVLGNREPEEVSRPKPALEVREAPPPPPPGPEAESPQKEEAREISYNPLKVVSYRPTTRTFNYRDAIIEVEFNMPMDPASTEAAFSIDPPVEGAFSWPNPNKLVFTPKALLELEGRYLVSFDDRATDSTGFNRLPPTSWSFSIVGGYFYTTDIKPLVKAYCSSCHRPEGQAAGVALNTFEEVRRYVEPGNAENSPFYTALKDSNHRNTLDKKALAQAHMIQDWIEKNQAGD